jgi:hypothetical protein
MAISGFSPTAALPGLVPGAQLAGSNPLLAAQGGSFPGSAQLAAQAAVGEKPGIVTRFMSAMRAAVGELRGVRPSDEQIRSQVLAMQAQQPVTLAKKPVTTKAKTFTDKQGNVRQIGTGKIIKPTTRPAAAATPATQPVGGQALPTNATQLPGATMYSYDANGNPVSAPTMQQLGMNPTMLQGLTGMAGAVDPDGPQGPQVNATNQTNLGLGSGLGMGSAVPVLGAPILTTSPGDTAPTTPHNGTGGTQSVTNRNATDINNRNQGFGMGYPGGYGGWGDPTGGVATPFSPYGSSMTGAYTLGNQGGLLSRLF